MRRTENIFLTPKPSTIRVRNRQENMSNQVGDRNYDRGRRRRRRPSDESDDDEKDLICGEDVSGFPVWTSAHGFKHYGNTNSYFWRVVWLLLILICTICLIALILYYFVHVFKSAIYSQVIIENTKDEDWPVIVVCEKQAFQQNKIQSVTSLGTDAASYLTWSLGPNLARPDVYDSSSSVVTNAKSNLDLTLALNEYNGDYQKLITALTPSCTDFILECKHGSTIYNSADCCSNFFNSKWAINQYGTCYSTAESKKKIKLSGAGEINGFEVVTKHENTNTFNPNIASSDLIDARGVSFAVVDKFTTIEAALRTRGQNAPLGTVSSIGLTRYLIDNSALENSLIGRKECTPNGDRDVDSDFLIGIDSDYGYTSDNCESAKNEMLSRELLSCTFHPLSNVTTNNITRCSPDHSVLFYKGFVSDVPYNATNVPKLSGSIKERYDKPCPQDCTIDKYTMSVSSSEMSNEIKSSYATKLGAAGNSQSLSVIVLKFFFKSLDYQRIKNFPQNGLQFLAEIAGLMSFFLGISIISIFECLFYLTTCECCDNCGCCRDDDDDDDDDDPNDDLPPPRRRGRTDDDERDVQRLRTGLDRIRQQSSFKKYRT